MLSIGEFAKTAKISPRAVRHYESLGLIQATVRGENNYRYFDGAQLDVVGKIRDLQRLGFSLDEVREVLALGSANMTTRLQAKLASAEQELSELQGRRDRLTHLLAISQKVDTSQALRLDERRMYMEAIKGEVLQGVRQRQGGIDDRHLEHLQRGQSLYDAPEKREFLEAVKACLRFAREHNLTLGPGRGSCPASIILYGLGFSGIDPTKYDLIPERLASLPPDIHIDVEFERGQPFVDFCRKLSTTLSWGQITAFKMPLLDIIAGVHRRIGHEVDYQAIDDDDEIVLDGIRRGEIDKIFLLDYSPDALVMKYENHLPEYVGNGKIKEYLRSQTIHSFRDVINIIAVWRPNAPAKLACIERYRLAKENPWTYDFLTPALQALLAPNFGLALYHEDLMHIIAAYTAWDMERCNRLRRDLFLGNPNPDTELFKAAAPSQVFDLVVTEAPLTFCKAHAMSFAQFTKRTAVLKALHQEAYLDEISAWEQRHGLVWDDIGIKIKGVSLLQH